jgi:hypothetical protein
MTQSTWIETRSGRRFDVANPREEDVDIEDIALALAQTCRFGGHALRWISVAWHSVVVHDIMAMLRKDSTARLARCCMTPPKPMWATCPGRSSWHSRISSRPRTECRTSFTGNLGLQPSSELLALIRKVDNQTLLEEARAYMATGGRGWELPDEGLKIPGAAFVPPCPRDFHDVGRAFLERFHRAYERPH